MVLTPRPRSTLDLQDSGYASQLEDIRLQFQLFPKLEPETKPRRHQTGSDIIHLYVF